MNSSRHNWIFAGLLTLPLVIVFLSLLFNHSSSLRPTGFFQFDNVSYVAYAHEYLDADSLRLEYANPYDEYGDHAIYFQPQTLFFSFLLRIGIPVSSVLIPFTLICSFLCFRICIALYDHLIPSRRFRIRNIVLLGWGGGLLALAGMSYHFVRPASDLLNDAFLLDPEHGWWGLNLGRSLFFSCEAYYHLLFLGTIYLVIQKKWAGALTLVFLLSLSHPFTGLELALIVLVWACVEKFMTRNAIPLWFLAGCVFVLAFHFWYYLYYLEQFADHRSVREQYSLPWQLRWYRMIPAYGLVAALAINSFVKMRRGFFSDASTRLFVCWFVLAFLLANHEVFMAPRQPVHFTRGYIWTSLFLLGLPALQAMNNWMAVRSPRLAPVLLLLLFLSDNGLWIADYVRSRATTPSITHINSAQDEVLNWINEHGDANTLLVCDDLVISNLSTVRSHVRPWYGHPYTTPFAMEKRAKMENYFKTGVEPSEWKGRHVLFVYLPSNLQWWSSGRGVMIGPYKLVEQ